MSSLFTFVCACVALTVCCICHATERQHSGGGLYATDTRIHHRYVPGHGTIGKRILVRRGLQKFHRPVDQVELLLSRVVVILTIV
ncbi:hypothetical protein ElyMa_006072700 [Elysia marginata]|uniref:Secreted protein n=1 Tax=Elysia marginata TaxID=1093978 RepID=A0AAV4GPI4_9GAST|nr:hypothetical protein ElyMa_006072700 [Elysia marginata]